MQKRSRKLEQVQEVAEIETMDSKVAKNSKARSVMAEMGSKGGRIGGKQRALNMTAEQRKHAASLAARVRWGKNAPAKIMTFESKQQIAARKLAVLFEEQLTALGLTEREKDQRVAEFSAFVDEKVSTAQTSKSPKQLHSEALQA